MDVPKFEKWEDAFNFAQGELMGAFEALADGDLVVSKALNASGKEANAVARKLFEAEYDRDR